ncbi:MAG: hypothetical protein WBC73_16170 [Phormidesmis sp.]
MSLSPLKSGYPRPSQSTHTGAETDGSPAEPLTLFQALIITAGLAGLIGLCSGATIRFALAHSANARFLSPLQTFPTDEAEEPLAENSTPKPLASDPMPTFAATDEAVDVTTFDTFSNRESESSRLVDPQETLERGPVIGDSLRDDSDNYLLDGETDYDITGDYNAGEDYDTEEDYPRVEAPDDEDSAYWIGQ